MHSTEDCKESNPTYCEDIYNFIEVTIGERNSSMKVIKYENGTFQEHHTIGF